MTIAYTALAPQSFPRTCTSRRKDSQLLSTSWKDRRDRGKTGYPTFSPSRERGYRGMRAGRSQVTPSTLPACVHCCTAQRRGCPASKLLALCSWASAVEFGPYHRVVCNPPYVPHDPIIDLLNFALSSDQERAWDCRNDGPTCPLPIVRDGAAAPGLWRHAAARAIRFRISAFSTLAAMAIGRAGC